MGRMKGWLRGLVVAGLAMGLVVLGAVSVFAGELIHSSVITYTDMTNAVSSEISNMGTPLVNVFVAALALAAALWIGFMAFKTLKRLAGR